MLENTWPHYVLVGSGRAGFGSIVKWCASSRLKGVTLLSWLSGNAASVMMLCVFSYERAGDASTPPSHDAAVSRSCQFTAQKWSAYILSGKYHFAGLSMFFMRAWWYFLRAWFYYWACMMSFALRISCLHAHFPPTSSRRFSAHWYDSSRYRRKLMIFIR